MHIYNTTLPPIPIKAYGRHINAMIQLIHKSPDKALRTQQAQALVKLMKKVSQSDPRAENDAQIWAHLLHIAGGNLDIETPFPIEAEKENPKLAKPTMLSKGKYQKYCGYYFSRLAEHAKKAIEKEPAQAETLIPALIKCSQMVHKKEGQQNILPHLENLLGQTITITPEIERLLSKKNSEKKKKYTKFRNEKKY